MIQIATLLELAVLLLAVGTSLHRRQYNTSRVPITPNIEIPDQIPINMKMGMYPRLPFSLPRLSFHGDVVKNARLLRLCVLFKVSQAMFIYCRISQAERG